MQSISNQAGGGGSMATPTINASQIKSLDLGRRDKPDYFALTGTMVLSVCVCMCVCVCVCVCVRGVRLLKKLVSRLSRLLL